MNWQRKQFFPLLPAKRRRTEEEQNHTSAQKHPPLPPCSCRAKCSDKFSVEERLSIWEKFWSLSYNRRRDWICNNVLEMPKTLRKNDESKSRRTYSLVWKFGETQVCKHFFLSSLGFKCDKVVRSALSCRNAVPFTGVIVGAYGDKRGYHEPPNKFSEQYRKQVVDYIESFRPQVSHYKRDHALIAGTCPRTLRSHTCSMNFVRM